MISTLDTFIVDDYTHICFNEYGDLIITASDQRDPSSHPAVLHLAIPKRTAIKLADFIIQSLDGEELETPSRDKIKRLKSRHSSLTRREINLKETK